MKVRACPELYVENSGSVSKFITREAFTFVKLLDFWQLPRNLKVFGKIVRYSYQRIKYCFDLLPLQVGTPAVCIPSVQNN